MTSPSEQNLLLEPLLDPGKLIEHPFDTVKVLLQAQNTSNAKDIAGTVRYRGVWHCVSHTYKTSGIRGLYKGLLSPLLGSTFEVAVLFAAVGRFKQALASNFDVSHMPVLSAAVSGAFGGLVVPFVLTPIELIKCRLQVQQGASRASWMYKGPWDCLVKTVRQDGLSKGLYRGNCCTLLREIPGCFCWFGTYELVCQTFSTHGNGKENLSPVVHMLGGGIAGVAYWTSGYVADTVKTQIQTNPSLEGKGFRYVLSSIYAKEGIRGLYRGLVITCFRATPAHAIMFLAYEQAVLMQ